MKEKKEIKTNYKVAVLANKIEKMLNKKLKIYVTSNYVAWQKKLRGGDRYVYVTSEKDGVLTNNPLKIIMDCVNPIADEYKCGRICQGVTIIEREKAGKWVKEVAYYILIAKTLYFDFENI